MSPSTRLLSIMVALVACQTQPAADPPREPAAPAPAKPEDYDTLPDWSALATIEDASLPLLDVALLIARDEYPQLDLARCVALLSQHTDHLRVEVNAIEHWALKMQAINRHLFDELGYAGNHDEYYDPRNSYVNDVLERRLGNSISLAMVQIEVARRLGVPLDGVSFPGHFLVRLPIDDGVLVMDPFNRGRPLDVDGLRQRARPHLGGDTPDDEALHQILHPASHRASPDARRPPHLLPQPPLGGARPGLPHQPRRRAG